MMNAALTITSAVHPINLLTEPCVSVLLYLLLVVELVGFYLLNFLINPE